MGISISSNNMNLVVYMYHDVYDTSPTDMNTPHKTLQLHTWTKPLTYNVSLRNFQLPKSSLISNTCICCYNCWCVTIFRVGTIIKRQAHNNFAGLFFGLTFTKTNPEFLQSVKSQFSPESKLLLVCQEGLRSVFETSSMQILISLRYNFWWVTFGSLLQ